MARNPRGSAEFPELVKEQIHLLQRYCHAFDEGDQAMAKPISTSLRLLLVDALLERFGLLSGLFVDSAGEFDPKHVGPWSRLTMMRLTNTRMGAVRQLHREALRREHTTATSPVRGVVGATCRAQRQRVDVQST